MALVKRMYHNFPGLKPPGFQGHHMDQADGAAKETSGSFLFNGDLVKTENNQNVNGPSRWLS